MSKISIIIADAQFLIRQGIKHLVSTVDDFEMVGTVGNEKALLELLETEKPDVVILDYNQAANFSPATIPAVKSVSPGSNVLVISADNDRSTIYKVLEDGVNSYLTKSCESKEIIDAIKSTAAGEHFFCSKVLEHIMAKSFPGNSPCAPTPLSAREIEIVNLISKGKIAKEIAKELNLSTHTVYTHRKNILKKLNLNNSSELVLYAVEHGFIKTNQTK